MDKKAIELLEGIVEGIEEESSRPDHDVFDLPGFLADVGNDILDGVGNLLANESEEYIRGEGIGKRLWRAIKNS